jgi:hypothetical protein
MSSVIPIATIAERSLSPHQARQRVPTPYEDLLGDSIERAFAAGVTELDALVEALNKTGPLGPNSQAWTPALYQQEIAKLGL